MELLAAVDWMKWLTPETIVAILTTVAAVLSYLGKQKAAETARTLAGKVKEHEETIKAVVKGVEVFRAPLRKGTPEEKALAEGLRNSIKGEALATGVEGNLNPLVQAVAALLKGK